MNTKLGLTILRLVLGVVVLIEAVLFLLPSAAHAFAATHMPGFVRLVLAGGEIVGCVLMLIPKTAIRGAWLLFAVFVMAILVHLLHGQLGVGNVLIYAAAALAIALGGS
jgi:hypothetical protein